jgi:hypothetical protein
VFNIANANWTLNKLQRATNHHTEDARKEYAECGVFDAVNIQSTAAK